MWFFKKRTKYFCVGVNKTGTTSIEKVFRSLKMRVGDQGTAELLIHDCAKGDPRSDKHGRTHSEPDPSYCDFT